MLRNSQYWLLSILAVVSLALVIVNVELVTVAWLAWTAFQTDLLVSERGALGRPPSEPSNARQGPGTKAPADARSFSRPG